ncbi:MAG: hypothetical protein ACR2PA_06935 [Hyphomicrobiaceae bacterium]
MEPRPGDCVSNSETEYNTSNDPPVAASGLVNQLVRQRHACVQRLQRCQTSGLCGDRRDSNGGGGCNCCDEGFYDWGLTERIGWVTCPSDTHAIAQRLGETVTWATNKIISGSLRCGPLIVVGNDYPSRLR